MDDEAVRMESPLPPPRERPPIPPQRPVRGKGLPGRPGITVGKEIPSKSPPRPTGVFPGGAKPFPVKSIRGGSGDVSEPLLERSGAFPQRIIQGKPVPSRPPPPPPVDRKVSLFAPAEILLPEEIDPRPLRASERVRESRGPLDWGNGQHNKALFRGKAAIELGSAGKVMEEIVGVETRDLAQKMLKLNAVRAKFLGLFEQANRFLGREQEWVHSGAFRQSAATLDVSEIAAIETTNHQIHRVTGKTGTGLCFEQFGGLSDHRNGYVSLKILKELVKNPAQQAAFVQSLERALAATHSEKEKSVIRHALSEVQHPQEALKQRHFLLEQQMLLVVHNRLKTAAESKTIKDGSLHLSHLSLLNPNLKKTEPVSGIRHDESTMIDDMSEIFKEFDGREICFEDTEVPYVKDGVIYMPKSLGTQRITIHTHYGNISTQGRRTAQGDRQQDECNRAMLAEMQSSLEVQLRENPSEERRAELVLAKTILARCTKDLKEHRQSFHLAADLLEVQILLGWQVSTGCYSNKDRGGVAGAMLCTTHLACQQELASKRPVPGGRPQLLEEARRIRLLGLRSLEAGSLQRQVATYNNADQTALKVDVIHDIKSPRGALVAIKNAFGIGKDLIMLQIRAFCKRTKISIF